MITLITGAPGSGKTAALVQLLDRFVKEGRAIFVDGIPELQLPHVHLEDPRRWHVDVPDGSIIVIDEAQRVWRPVGVGSKVAPDIEALETHRHSGIEFYLLTQHPNLLHANVRRLVSRHIHLRDTGITGRWWYEWPEAANPESWRTAPVKVKYKLPRKLFGTYKSASLHVKTVRRVPPALIIAILAIGAAGYLSWSLYGRISSSMGKSDVKASPAGLQASVGAPTAARAVEARSKPESAPEAATPVLVGCIAMGKRCECIADDGRSVNVLLDVCTRSSSRGGLEVPYLLVYPRSDPLPSASPGTGKGEGVSPANLSAPKPQATQVSVVSTKQ